MKEEQNSATIWEIKQKKKKKSETKRKRIQKWYSSLDLIDNPWMLNHEHKIINTSAQISNECAILIGDYQNQIIKIAMNK